MQKLLEFEGLTLYTCGDDGIMVIPVATLRHLTESQISRLTDLEKQLRREVELIDMYTHSHDWSFLKQFLRDSDYTTILTGQLCPDHMKKSLRTYLSTKDWPISQKDKENDPGIYLLQAGSFYKIGHSKNVSKRLMQLRIQLPYKTSLVCVIHTQDHYELEVSLHERFKNKRKNGEWFELSETDVAYIKQIAEQQSEVTK